MTSGSVQFQTAGRSLWPSTFLPASSAKRKCASSTDSHLTTTVRPGLRKGGCRSLVARAGDAFAISTWLCNLYRRIIVNMRFLCRNMSSNIPWLSGFSECATALLFGCSQGRSNSQPTSAEPSNLLVQIMGRLGLGSGGTGSSRASRDPAPSRAPAAAPQHRQHHPPVAPTPSPSQRHSTSTTARNSGGRLSTWANAALRRVSQATSQAIPFKA